MTRRDDEHISDEHISKVARALAEAHRARHEPSLGVDWNLQVMRAIRLEAAEQGSLKTALRLDRLVWRTATVAAVLALVFTGSVLFYATGDAVELTALMSSEFDATVSLVE
ncbi:MAG: hypothetical protein Q8N00_05380 [Nitrospirota bacterium]|nr:hypothetical protein [Nitrospirota bacterium]MDP3595493.1 hypothetical protein [Nitrospirota bacterium]